VERCILSGHGNQLVRQLPAGLSARFSAVMHDSQNGPAKLNETAARPHGIRSVCRIRKLRSLAPVEFKTHPTCILSSFASTPGKRKATWPMWTESDLLAAGQVGCKPIRWLLVRRPCRFGRMPRPTVSTVVSRRNTYAASNEVRRYSIS